MTQPPARLSAADWALALLTVSIWGTNFVVIRLGLDSFPPLLFAGLRFFFTAFPMILFVAPVRNAWRPLVGYGLLIGPGVFGLMFIAMDGHISPGLTSLLMQTQVVFTVLLASLFKREALHVYQFAAAVLCTAGLYLIFAHTGADATPLGIVLILGAALCWAGANIVASLAGTTQMLSFITWTSLFAFPPLLLMSAVFEGTPRALAALHAAGTAAWAAVAWQSAGNTLVAFAIWNWLLKRYAAATIVPLALLIPIIGMALSSLILAEPMPGWKLCAFGLVLAGLAINQLWPAVRRAKARRVQDMNAPAQE